MVHESCDSLNSTWPLAEEVARYRGALMRFHSHPPCPNIRKVGRELPAHQKRVHLIPPCKHYLAPTSMAVKVLSVTPAMGLSIKSTGAGRHGPDQQSKSVSY